MAPNPFESPGATSSQPIPRGPWRPVSFFVLLGLYALTTLLATVNALDEKIGNPLFVLIVVAVAGVDQLPGIVIAFVARWLPRFVGIPLLLAAYAIALTGTLAYGLYAIDGKADSLNSAAHMHVILFPVLHTLGAATAYVVALLASFVAILISRARRTRPAAW